MRIADSPEKLKGEIVDNNFRFALFNVCHRPACRLLDEAVFCRFRIAQRQMPEKGEIIRKGGKALENGEFKSQRLSLSGLLLHR